jgi:hypothetical protein
MRWLFVTVGLLLASVCLVGWIYLRDHDTSGWRPSERQRVQSDASTALIVISDAGCRSGCATEVLGRTRPHRWLVRLTVRGRSRCLQIDVDTFRVSQRHGFTGVQSRRCPSPQSETAHGG